MKTDANPTTDDLRPILHGKIDQLDANGLQILHRVLLKLEVEELAKKLTDRIASRPELLERIDVTVAEVRREHPYQ